jgi:hypothetical protein
MRAIATDTNGPNPRERRATKPAAHAANALRRRARLAGLAYLAIIVVSILDGAFVDAKLIIEGNAAATAENIRAHLGLFRFGLAVHLIMFAGVVFLAWALYVTLRSVDRDLALLGLLWRMAEAALGTVSVLGGLLAAQLLDGDSCFASFDAAQVQRLAALALGARDAALNLTIFFLCLGTMVFSYLFLWSRCIPRALAVLGLASFPAMLAGVMASAFAPRYAGWALPTFGAPALFEFGVGAWLLVKGVNLAPPGRARAGDARAA